MENSKLDKELVAKAIEECQPISVYLKVGITGLVLAYILGYMRGSKEKE